MAIKNSDRPENQGLRPIVRKHFGRSESGKSFLRGAASEALSNISGGYSDRRNSSGITSRSVRTLMGVGMLAAITNLFVDAGHDMYHSGFEGAVENDVVFHGDPLTAINDESGYVIVRTGDDDSAVMLYKSDDGAYAMFEGTELNDNDWQFDYITDVNRAAYLSLAIANDLQEQAAFPNMIDAPQLLSFEGVSSPIIDEKGQIYRAADNIINDENANGVSVTYPVMALTGLFEEASTALQNGAAHIDTAPVSMENPIQNPADDPQAQLSLFLNVCAGLAGLSVAGGLASANAASRRRFRKETLKEHKPS